MTLTISVEVEVLDAEVVDEIIVPTALLEEEKDLVVLDWIALDGCGS